MSAARASAAASHKTAPPFEETDNLQRSTKKMKNDEDSTTSSVMICDETIGENKNQESYRDKLLAIFGDSGTEEELWCVDEEEL